MPDSSLYFTSIILQLDMLNLLWWYRYGFMINNKKVNSGPSFGFLSFYEQARKSKTK